MGGASSRAAKAVPAVVRAPAQAASGANQAARPTVAAFQSSDAQTGTRESTSRLLLALTRLTQTVPHPRHRWSKRLVPKVETRR